MKKFYLALLGVILCLGIGQNVVFAATVEEAVDSPFVKAVKAAGGTVDHVVDTGCCAGWCGSKMKDAITKLPDGIATAGGHLGKLLSGTKDAIQASNAVLKNNQIFVSAVLKTAKAAGADTAGVEKTWNAVLKTSNQATLFVDTNAVFQFFSNPSTEGIDSTFNPIQSLLAPTDANYLWFLGSYASILMPDDYSAGPGLTKSQNAVLFTMATINFFKQEGTVTISSTDATTTVLKKGTATLSLKNNSTAVPDAINILTTTARIGQLIGDLATGTLTLTQLNNLVPTLKVTPTFYAPA
jgi:hypothetical protein